MENATFNGEYRFIYIIGPFFFIILRVLYVIII
jgi:hypothetical protein